MSATPWTPRVMQGGARTWVSTPGQARLRGTARHRETGNKCGEGDCRDRDTRIPVLPWRKNASTTGRPRESGVVRGTFSAQLWPTPSALPRFQHRHQDSGGLHHGGHGSDLCPAHRCGEGPISGQRAPGARERQEIPRNYGCLQNHRQGGRDQGLVER